jgi:predicted DCC family thiol-disulfide oxidoreductase YuxK
MPDDLRALMGDARLLVIFDGWCGVCTRCVDWVQARDTSGRLLVLPNQTPGLLERTGLTRADVDRAVWVITRTGRRYEGAAAINRALRELGGWRHVAGLYRVPGVRWCEDRLYAWFAPNRGHFSRWGATPACERPGVLCEPEG